jgi:hypothetical protein
MAMRLSGVPPLPSFGVLLGSTNVTRSSLRRRDFGDFGDFGFGFVGCDSVSVSRFSGRPRRGVWTAASWRGASRHEVSSASRRG